MLGNPVQENPNTGKPSNNIKQESIKQEINKTIEVNNKGEVEIVEFVSFRDQLFETWFDYKKQKKSKYTEIGKATKESVLKHRDIEIGAIYEIAYKLGNGDSYLKSELIMHTDDFRTLFFRHPAINNCAL